MADNVIYTVTGQGCNGAANAVWAIDLNGSAPRANSFELNGGSVWGLAGPTIGSDGTVYVQTGEGPFEPSSHKWSNSILALNPRDLKLKQYFTSARAAAGARRDTDMNVPSPVVFSYRNRDLIVTAGKDGRLYLLDSASLGGDDHRTPMYRTPQIAADETSSADHGIWGGLTSWADAGGTRWVLAPVWGALHKDFKVPGMNGSTPNGSIVAFKVEEQDGKAVLTPAWVSRDMSSPEPPVVAGGVVFGLSAGEFSRQVKEAAGAISIEERPKGSAHATLYALDAATGKELYSSRNQVSAPAALTGLTVSNWRVYFGGEDGAIYAFGLNMEH
jgi:outer membrane protein assembly factor BamB